MEFEIKYYQDSKGNRPVEEFLLELKRVNSPLAAKTIKGLEKLKNRVYHKEPLSKYLEPGLWELRINAGSDILRILYTFRKDKIIILLHAFVKKQQKTPEGELEIVRKRLDKVKREES